MTSVSIDQNGEILTLNSGGQQHRFHAIWLRDNAQDQHTRSPGNGQRLITLRDISPDTKIRDARVEGDGLAITFDPEDRTIDYETDWLIHHSYDQ